MSGELALPAIRTKRFKRPPKALFFYALKVAVWASWMLVIAMNGIHYGISFNGGCEVLLGVWYARILARDYAKMRKMLSDWLAGKHVKDRVTSTDWSILGLFVIASAVLEPLSLINNHVIHGI